MEPSMIVLRALGALLSYPHEEIRQALPEIAEAIRASQLIPPPQREDLLTLIDVGGIAGLIAIVGLTILVHRRLADPRIRLNSRKWDIAVILILWLQLALGLSTVPLSAFHMDGVLFGLLVAYVKGIVTFNGSTVALMSGVPLVYKLHILLGFTIFLISPFTRMIHIWSGVGALAYLFRPYQIVRSPRTRARVPVRS
jgi:nitrate reductase gamma subunit